jgi:hypothetical protein
MLIEVRKSAKVRKSKRKKRVTLSDLGGLSDFRTKTPIFAHVKIDDRVRHRRF